MTNLLRLAARSQATRVACLFTVLTLIATYPIAKAPASYAYFSHSDAQLNMWIMAWEAHALRTEPAKVFDANIFHPTADTLAYSETLLGYLPIFGPVLWLHGSPPLAFNLVLLFSFVASGLAMYALARHVTGREWPGIVAGIVYAFVPYRFVHVPQIQLEAMEWLPLSFLCLHLALERSDFRSALRFGATVVMGALTCVYYGVFQATGLAVAFAAFVAVDRQARDIRRWVRIAVAGTLALVVLSPLIAEYVHVNRHAGLERTTTEISERGADLASYFASGAPVHQALGLPGRKPPHDYLFPGFAALALAATGLLMSRSRRLVAVYALVGVFGLMASNGPSGPFSAISYDPLAAVLPVLRGLRQISRFGVLTIFSVSVLAAFGCAALEGLVRRRTVAWQIAIAAVAFLELCPSPLRFDRPDGDALTLVPDPQPVYRWLAQQTGPFAVLELPLPHVGQAWRNAPYVYWTTAHWHPIVNGYSGYQAPDYMEFRRTLDQFPDESSRKSLAARDVRFIVLHHDRFTRTDRPINLDRLARTHWLRLAAQFPETDVFETQQDLAMHSGQE
jgi:hypothetical protein